MKKDISREFEKLKEKATNGVLSVPMQKVVANESADDDSKGQLNVRIGKTLLKQLKQRSLDQEKSVQSMVSEALKNYLS